MVIEVAYGIRVMWVAHGIRSSVISGLVHGIRVVHGFRVAHGIRGNAWYWR